MSDPLAGLSLKLISQTKQSLNTIRELDAAMAELADATSMTAAQLEVFYDSANDIAHQTGFTTQEIIRQAAAWSRLGFAGAEATAQMAKLSAQLRRLAPDLTTEAAISGLLKIIKTYGLESGDILDGVLSKMAAVGQQFALHNADIFNVLQTSVAVMGKANNTLDETIALEAAALALTHDTGVTDALQTAALRLRGMNRETMETDSSLRNLKTTLLNLTGVSVMDDPSDPSDYKSTYRILKEISTVWHSLSDTTRSSVSELIFGKADSPLGASLLANFADVETALHIISGSAGSAERAIGTSMDSIDAKIHQIKETGTGIAQNIFDREGVKSALDLIAALGNALDFLTGKFGSLSSIGAGIGLFAGLKNIGKRRMSVRLSKPVICLLF